jgi:ElaB/YqjD/DUF883 family membrane-anchored ribosome-binding protein
MSTVREQESQSVTEQAKERVAEVTEQAKSQTHDRMRSQINERSTQVGDQTASAAKAVRRGSEQLRAEGNDRAADVIDAVADRGDRLGAYLRRADGDQILRDLEDFARKQPWLMVGGSAVAGFLASRFLKATSRERFRGVGPNGYPSRSATGADPRLSVRGTNEARALSGAGGDEVGLD